MSAETIKTSTCDTSKCQIASRCPYVEVFETVKASKDSYSLPRKPEEIEEIRKYLLAKATGKNCERVAELTSPLVGI